MHKLHGRSFDAFINLVDLQWQITQESSLIIYDMAVIDYYCTLFSIKNLNLNTGFFNVALIIQEIYFVLNTSSVGSLAYVSSVFLSSLDFFASNRLTYFCDLLIFKDLRRWKEKKTSKCNVINNNYNIT